ncbi:MAG: PorT family protein [Saprospiraceae bacterium]|nr:PorT family protein [Bacteroidia bacterium]NNE13865.1 PorT family protein [Saprospiraceae bacterium]NNL91793.1 PorT family protein [Saprospiraceae bacterium]
MKKYTILITTCFLVILGTNLISQNKVSVISGIHTANISAEGLNADFLDINSISRFMGGVLYERALDKHLDIRTGVIYKTKGFKLNEAINVDIFNLPLPIGVKVTSELNTIDVPLMLTYNFKNNSNITPYFSAGPNFSYATSGAIRTKATAILDFTLTNTPLDLSSDAYNRLGIEGQLAGGVKIPYGKGEITTEFAYSHAMNNFTSDDFIIDTGIKNKGLSFSIGYGMYF